MIRVPRFGMLAATLVILAQTAACSTPATGRTADEAWSTRLTQQAERLQQEAARDEARMERAHDAWTQRLQAQLVSYQAEQATGRAGSAGLVGPAHRAAGSSRGPAGMSDRAAAAWTERLTRLAERSAASR